MGCSEYKRSLDTKDSEEALRRFPAALAESNTAFALAKQAQAGHEELNASDARQLGARWFVDERKRLEASEDWARWLVIGEGAHGPEGHTLSFVLDETQDLQGWRKTFVLPAIAEALRAHGQPMPPDGSPLLQQLVNVFSNHINELSRWALDNWLSSGCYVPPPAVMPYAPTSVELKRDEEAKLRKPGEAVDILHSPASKVFMRDVLDDWAMHGKPGRKPYPQKTINKYKLAVERFEARPARSG